MHAGPADQIMNKGHLIHDFAQRRDDLAQMFSALAIGLKSKRRLHPRSEPILKSLNVFAKVGLLAVMFFQSRFVIEQIEVTRRAGHKELHNSLSLRRVMQHFHLAPAPGFASSAKGAISVQERGQGQTAEAAA